MRSNIVLGLILITSLSIASVDSDMDGVIDSIDECANTPFLNEVDASGCPTNTILLFEDRADNSLEVDIGYSLSNDEDALDRHNQNLTSLQIGYYLNDWSYTVRTGYFRAKGVDGFSDSTLKIKKRFHLFDSLKLYIGGSIKLPTYDFTGNKTDYTLYLSSTYYPSPKLSIFAGWSHTFIKDIETIGELKDTDSIYTGVGYSYNKDIYINLAYMRIESKFLKNHADQSIMSTLFYNITPKYFTTITYSQEIGEDNIDNKLNIRLGYRVW